MDAIRQPFVKITQEKNLDYASFFRQKNHLANYIDFALYYSTPEIWVDNETQPRVGAIFSPPAVCLQGDPDVVDISPLFHLIAKDSWIVPTSEKWEQHIVSHFGASLEVQNRTSFDHTSLSLAHLQSLKKELPAGMRLIQVGEKESNDAENILHKNDLQYYFASVDFVQRGLGFCILDGELLVAYASSNFPIHNNLLEVSIRVINDEKYRGKGLAQAVSIALMEYCLQHNIEPNWDAANQTSVYIALKLGYTVKKEWRMYHLLEN